jgi:hypothetical protein
VPGQNERMVKMIANSDGESLFDQFERIINVKIEFLIFFIPFIIL